MSEMVNEQELVNYIASKTKADPKSIRIVLKHEQTFMNNMQKRAQAEIDSDELVDYVLGRPDVKLHEPVVEAILEAEMSYLIDNGLADYED